MISSGFILLHRKITEWEWYQNPNTFRVFLHCLLMANFADGRFEGKDIKRGQFVTSLPSLSEQTKLSVRQVRVALDHLILTGELTNKSFTKYRIITVVNYDRYQGDDRQNDSQMTDKCQTNDSQMTDKRQQYNNNNNNKKKNNNNNHHFIEPTPEDVAAYCEEKGFFGFDAAHFVNYYEARGWMLTKGRKMVDWRAAVRTWIRNDEERRKEKQRELYDDLPM